MPTRLKKKENDYTTTSGGIIMNISIREMDLCLLIESFT